MQKDIIIKFLASHDIKISRGLGLQSSTICVNDESFYDNIIINGLSSIGDSYINGKCQIGDLESLITKLILINDRYLDMVKELSWSEVYQTSKLFTLGNGKYYLNKFIKKETSETSQSVKPPRLPDLFYEQMLGLYLQYSSGIWESDDDLDSSQLSQMDEIIGKMKLTDGLKILDLSCGWGQLAAHIASTYAGCQVDAMSPSLQQITYAKKKYAHLTNLSFKCQNYQSINQSDTYHRIISVEPFEQTSNKDLKQYFQMISKLLKPKGIFLYQLITTAKHSPNVNSWINKFLFPNVQLHDLSQVFSTSVETPLKCEQIINYSSHYTETIKSWSENFLTSWPILQKYDHHMFNDQFQRSWQYYLLLFKSLLKESCLSFYECVFTKDLNEIYIWQ